MKTAKEWFYVLHCGTTELAGKIESVFKGASREDIEAIQLDARAELEELLRFWETHCACDLILPRCQCPHCKPHNDKLSPAK